MSHIGFPRNSTSSTWFDRHSVASKQNSSTSAKGSKLALACRSSRPQPYQICLLDVTIFVYNLNFTINLLIPIVLLYFSAKMQKLPFQDWLAKSQAAPCNSSARHRGTRLTWLPNGNSLSELQQLRKQAGTANGVEALSRGPKDFEPRECCKKKEKMDPL